uniref:Uncharacterized protein n=1 Tax=viral metagenome TaxID=1070528 RepID=A0A2V0RHS7_9ZZZZ
MDTREPVRISLLGVFVDLRLPRGDALPADLAYTVQNTTARVALAVEGLDGIWVVKHERDDGAVVIRHWIGRDLSDLVSRRWHVREARACEFYRDDYATIWQSCALLLSSQLTHVADWSTRKDQTSVEFIDDNHEVRHTCGSPADQERFVVVMLIAEQKCDVAWCAQRAIASAIRGSNRRCQYCNTHLTRTRSDYIEY